MRLLKLINFCYVIYIQRIRLRLLKNSIFYYQAPPQKALAMQVLFSFERGDSHPWLTRVVRRRFDFPAQPPLFHGAATTIPHRLRFTDPLVATGANRRATVHKCVLHCSSFFWKRDELSCAQVRRLADGSRAVAEPLCKMFSPFPASAARRHRCSSRTLVRIPAFMANIPSSFREFERDELLVRPLFLRVLALGRRAEERFHIRVLKRCRARLLCLRGGGALLLEVFSSGISH